MSTTVEFTNLRATSLAHPGLSVAALETKSKVYKQVEADDYAVNFDTLAGFGVAVAEDGTYRTGVVEITAAGPVSATQHVVLIDTDGPGFTVTLPAASGLSDGHRIWIYLRTDGGGDATIDGAGSDTVLGNATAVMGTAGSVLRLILDGTNWAAQTV